MADAIRVCVTGAAGQIGYALLYSIANGDVFGPDQAIELVLLDITPMMTSLNGVVMELQDCALTLLKDVVASDNADEAFKNVDVVIMVGAMPRREGMERKDLLKANARIFEGQGRALDKYAKKTVKVLVVGNPANTNCLLTAKMAPSIPKENFTCLTRLDQNRAKAQIAAKVNVSCDKVHNVTIWGNHSSTQFPDSAHGFVETADGNKSVCDVVKDDAWLKGDFIKTVQQRGKAIIEARKLSSAMSAAKAICDHMKDWWFGTEEGKWTSMGVWSDGSYNVPRDIVYSFPVRINNDRTWEIVQGLEISDFAREKMEITAKELIEERDVAIQFLSAK